VGGGPSTRELPIRGELSPAALRRLARREGGGRVGRRVQAIATMTGGMSGEMETRAAENASLGYAELWRLLSPCRPLCALEGVLRWMCCRMYSGLFA
jgi:hypothetical protein